MNDIEKLEMFFKRNNKTLASDYTGFKDVDRVYLATNESLTGFKLDNLENKKILSITASGDQMLHFIMNGAKNIDAFDINVFTKYVAQLKIAMIKKYERNEFFSLYERLYRIKVLDSVVNDVRAYLDEDVFAFWNFYIIYIIENKPSLYYILGEKSGGDESIFLDAIDLSFFSSLKRCSYKDEESYTKTKNNLKEVNIRYIDSSIEKLEEFTKEKYDILYSSNILQRVKDHVCDLMDSKSSIDGSYIIFEMLLKMKNLIREDGCIYDYSLNDGSIGINGLLGKYKNAFDKKFSYSELKTENGKIIEYKKKSEK